MSFYLVTGESSAGESSIAAEFQKRGLTAYDTDQTPGLTYHADAGWLWDATIFEALLDTPDTIFICGASSNQEQFYPRFTHIFALTTAEKDEFITQLIEHGAILIDATQPPAKIIDEILSHTDIKQAGA